jgi:hypothetical protein
VHALATLRPNALSVRFGFVFIVAITNMPFAARLIKAFSVLATLSTRRKRNQKNGTACFGRVFNQKA